MNQYDSPLVAIERLEAASTRRPIVIIRKASEIEPEAIQWLWEGWLPKGKLSLLAGQPGQGKTTLALQMAAIVSSGGGWPDKSQAEKGNVLIWSGEDGYADTLLPRLVAAGANLDRCNLIEGVQLDGVARGFDPSSDLDALEKAIDPENPPHMIILDPIVNVVTGDGNKNIDVRRSLQPLVDFAESMKCAILGITHLGKSQSLDIVSKVMGSTAFVAVARTVLLVGPYEKNMSKKVLVLGKSNISKSEVGFTYTTESTVVNDEIKTSKIIWDEAVIGLADQLIGQTKIEDASDSLGKAILSLFSHGDAIPSNECISKLEELGFSNGMIDRKARHLGVLRFKGKNGSHDCWYWQLPSRSQINSQL